MFLGEVFERFAAQSPVSVMARAAFEHALSADAVDALFEEHARRQYTRDLLFSQVVDLMALVVCQVRPSLNAAIKKRTDLTVTRKAVYAKIGRTEPGLGTALVRRTADRLHPVLTALSGAPAGPLPGYRVRIVDGNHLPGTEHRVGPLRKTRAAGLPGQALVVFDPATGLVTDVIPCEDAHAQERSLTPEVLALVRAADVWVGDRNFCTTRFLFGIVAGGAHFVIRQHGSNLSVRGHGPAIGCGRTDTGAVSEGSLRVAGEDGTPMVFRRVTVTLDTPTRDGTTEIHILTNLPAEVTAAMIAEVYRSRWRIEGAFHELEAAIRGEVETLGHPKAALFAFCVALVAFNVLRVVKAAIGAGHGIDAEVQVSGSDLAEEIAGTRRGMVIAIAPSVWSVFARMTPAELAQMLRGLGRQVWLAGFRKQPRGPKKPRPPRESGAKAKHYATARLLQKRPQK
jgi:IS4 transposase